MAESCEVSFELTRDDWIAVGLAAAKTVSRQPSVSARHHRSAMLQKSAILSLFGGATFMYVWIASFFPIKPLMIAAGVMIWVAVSAAIFAFFLRTKPKPVDTSAYERSVQRMELSPYTGPHTVSIDQWGLHVRSNLQDTSTSWQLVQPTMCGEYITFHNAGFYLAIIPPRAFIDANFAFRFFRLAREWHAAAQLPHAERLAHYLADRDDAFCPQCRYNLRGVTIGTCPECGRQLSLDEFIRGHRPPRTDDASQPSA